MRVKMRKKCKNQKLKMLGWVKVVVVNKKRYQKVRLCFYSIKSKVSLDFLRMLKVSMSWPNKSIKIIRCFKNNKKGFKLQTYWVLKMTILWICIWKLMGSFWKNLAFIKNGSFKKTVSKCTLILCWFSMTILFHKSLVKEVKCKKSLLQRNRYKLQTLINQP